MARGWFVIQVYTGYENRVRTELERKRSSEELKDVIINVKVPEETYVVQVKNKKVNKTRNLYPGYVLAELDVPESDAQWKKVYASIKSITGVGMFLSSGGGNRRPAPLPYEEVRSIFEKTGEIKQTVTTMDSGYAVGEKVRVKEGPFKDFEGEIQEVMNDKNSLLVRVEIFGRLTPVELDFNQVQRL